MQVEIHNAGLSAVIDTKGAQLLSLRDADGTEYIWQRDNRYWEDSAPNLFPYIARLTEGKYIYRGKEYQMNIHGFLKDSELDVTDKKVESAVFMLRSDEATYGMYPWNFELRILYELKDSSLNITYQVVNLDKKKMFFGIGGHPGFRVPLEQGFSFEDYMLEFDSKDGAYRVGMSEDCYVTGEDSVFLKKGENIILLKHTLFDDDAVILSDMPKAVTLKTKEGKGKKVSLSYPGMNYLGIWHRPHTDAPYVCIEPWTSLPSRKGIVEDLEKQKNLLCLDPEQSYSNGWKIWMEALRNDGKDITC